MTDDQIMQEEQERDQEPRYCRICGQLAFNFYPSRIVRYDWICNSCSKNKKNVHMRKVQKQYKSYKAKKEAKNVKR